jgi:hypothetical protein
LGYYPKTYNVTICSIFSNSGHVDWCTASPDTTLKVETLVIFQTKLGSNWSSSFRENLWKILRHTTDDDDDDGRQVMTIADMTLWTRWANKNLIEIIAQCYRRKKNHVQWNKKGQFFGHYNTSPLFSKFFIRIKVWIRRHVKSIKQLVISNIRWNCVALMSIVTQEP